MNDLTEIKLKACQVKPIDTKPYSDELQALKEELAEHKEYCCYQKNEVLLLENKKLKSERDKLAYDLGVADTKNSELLRLLKECLPIVSAEVMTWQIRGGEESHQRGKELLTKIEEVLK